MSSSSSGGRGEHAALRHQLREPEAPQERGFASLIGARDDDQALAVGSDVVADRALVRGEREADVIELPARKSGSAELACLRKDEGRPELEQPSVKVETADVERQFPLQHSEEALDVLRALGEGVGREAEAAIHQLRHGPSSGFITRSEVKSVGVRRLPVEDFLDGAYQAGEPISRLERTAQDVALAFQSLAEPRAHENAVAELQALQLPVDELK